MRRWMLGAAVLIACEAPLPPQAPPAQAPRIEPPPGARVDDAWSADRTTLEAQAATGLVAVRMVGTKLESLPGCTLDGSYVYTPVTPKAEHLAIQDERELYAAVPLDAILLAPELRRAGRIDVTLTTVGRYDADRRRLIRGALPPACNGATHLLTGITVGAYEYAIRDGDSVDVLRRDGDAGFCWQPGSDGRAPPRCAAFLRLELVAVDEGTAPTANSPRPAGFAPLSPIAFAEAKDPQKLALLARNMNWATLSPGARYAVTGNYGRALFFPGARPFPVGGVNEYTTFAPDGKTLLVALDDMPPRGLVKKYGYALLSVPDLHELARFEGVDARYVAPDVIAYRHDRQAMKIYAKRGATPLAIGVPQTSLRCTGTDHYGHLVTPSLCKEGGASRVLGVDRDFTHWLVEDRGTPSRLRDVELATGKSTTLFEVEGKPPNTWTSRAKPDWREIEVRVAPDSARVCVTKTTHHYSGSSDMHEPTSDILCGPLPAGPFERVVVGQPRMPDVSFMTPTKLLIGTTIFDLDARTTQRLEMPVAAPRWLFPLPGGRRIFVPGLPALLLDVERRTFSLIGRRDGSHHDVNAAPDTDRRFVLSDDATPEAHAEGGRYLYWVDVSP